MPTRLHIAAKELRGDLAAYAKRFDLLEVRGVEAARLRAAPSAATLRRWRRAVPPQFEFAVLAGPSVGKLKPGDAFEAEVQAMLAAATVLESRVLVVPTDASVTPAKIWRDRLGSLVDRLRHDAIDIVWEPSGVWEIEDAAAQAKKWGIVVGVDPARDVVPAGPVAYARLRAAGGTRAFSTAALQKVADAIGERRDAYVIIETAAALKEGKVLRTLFRPTKPKRVGTSRLIRPRGAPLRVRDDEQEE
ncbi:MAG: DUF72 domain-containing protein [Labilithrix sp.]|nr:DUF72 domain-containing protein [Labilithrix sp.]